MKRTPAQIAGSIAGGRHVVGIAKSAKSHKANNVMDSIGAPVLNWKAPGKKRRRR